MKLFLKLEPFILPHEARYLGPRDISVTGVGPSQVSLHLLHVPVIAFTRGRGNSGGQRYLRLEVRNSPRGRVSDNVNGSLGTTLWILILRVRCAVTQHNYPRHLGVSFSHVNQGQFHLYPSRDILA